jgi:hypothetical protein
MDKLDRAGGMKEAVFTASREAYHRYELGRFKILVILKKEAICSSETSVYKVPRLSM